MFMKTGQLRTPGVRGPLVLCPFPRIDRESVRVNGKSYQEKVPGVSECSDGRNVETS